MTADVFDLGDLRRKARKPRPAKYVWVDTIKAHPKLGNYPHLSPRFLVDYAELLSSFSSFEHEGVYAGRPNLGSRLGVSIRHISRANLALADMGCLDVQRRGRTSNLVVPFLNGARLFSMGPEVTSKVTLDGTRRSHRTGVSIGPSGHPNLLKQDLNLHELNSPQPPKARQTIDLSPSLTVDTDSEKTRDVGDDVSTTCKQEASGNTSRSLARKEVEAVLNGEIVQPLSFSEFWNGSRRRSDAKDKPGPARKAFEMLSAEERQEISALLDRDGEIDLGGEWACVWLRARAWREAPLRKSGITGFFDSLRPRAGSREDRQEQTTVARRALREWAWREDLATGNNTQVGAPLGYGVASCPPGHYPIVEHTRAFAEWCQHYRRHRRVPPMSIDIVDQDGKRCRGFYMLTPYPPDDDGDGGSA